MPAHVAPICKIRHGTSVTRPVILLGRGGTCSIGVGRSQLARRLSSPPLECVSKCAHLHESRAARQSWIHASRGRRGNEPPDRAGGPQVSHCSSTFVSKFSCKRPLAHSQTASNVFD